MTYKTPEATKTQGAKTAKPRNQEREKLLNQARREALVKDLSAQVGPEDHTATDANGVDPSEAILGPGTSGRVDPVLARYQAACRGAILPNWTPLPTTVQKHPNYMVIVEVAVDATGGLGPPKVVKGTGDSSFDRSAVLAVIKTGKLPPPPAKYQASAAAGVRIMLSARDLQ